MKSLIKLTSILLLASSLCASINANPQQELEKVAAMLASHAQAPVRGAQCGNAESWQAAQRVAAAMLQCDQISPDNPAHQACEKIRALYFRFNHCAAAEAANRR